MYSVTFLLKSAGDWGGWILTTWKRPKKTCGPEWLPRHLDTAGMSWPPAWPTTLHQETPACWSRFLDLQTYINASAFQPTRDEGTTVTERIKDTHTHTAKMRKKTRAQFNTTE